MSSSGRCWTPWAELAALAEEHVGARDTVSPQELAGAAAAGLSPEQRARVEQAVYEQAVRLADGLDKSSTIIPSATTEAGPQPSLEQQIAQVVVALGPLRGDLATRMVADFATQPEVVSYAVAYGKAVAGTPRLPILLHALLVTAVTAVSTFEALLGGLWRQLFTVHFGAAGCDSKQLTVADYRALGSVEALEHLMIERRVDELLARGITGWAEQLVRTPGLDLPTLAWDWDRTVEVFLRRNAIVHNGGRVDQEYQRRLSAELPQPCVGEDLVVDAAYLDEALDRLHCLGSCLTFGFWAKLVNGGTATAQEEAEGYAALLLVQGRPQLSEAVVTGTLGLFADSDARRRHQVTAWLARRARLGSESVVQEVADWDLTGASPIFALAQHVLLGRMEAACELALRLLETGELTMADARSWPLFAELRATPGPLADRIVAAATGPGATERE